MISDNLWSGLYGLCFQQAREKSGRQTSLGRAWAEPQRWCHHGDCSALHTVSPPPARMPTPRSVSGPPVVWPEGPNVRLARGW